MEDSGDHRPQLVDVTNSSVVTGPLDAELAEASDEATGELPLLCRRTLLCSLNGVATTRETAVTAVLTNETLRTGVTFLQHGSYSFKCWDDDRDTHP